MAKFTLVAARDANGAIGKGGKIPWRVPEDLRYFKQVTMGKTLIVGRKTYQGLPVLLGRKLVVVSRQGGRNAAITVPDLDLPENCVFSPSPDVACAGLQHLDEVMVIGGAEIYRWFLEEDRADKVLMTELPDVRVEDPDTWFPPFPGEGWLFQTRFQEGPAVFTEWTRYRG